MKSILKPIKLTVSIRNQSLQSLLFWILISTLGVAWAAYRYATGYESWSGWVRVIALLLVVLWTYNLSSALSRVIRKDYNR